MAKAKSQRQIIFDFCYKYDPDRKKGLWDKVWYRLLTIKANDPAYYYSMDLESFLYEVLKDEK